MENEITVAGTASPSRDIAVVTAEIKELNRQAQKMALVYAVEIGRRLCEAKEMLEHGEWGKWLKEEVDFSQSTANNCMKLFREYGAEQITLFGAVTNSQAFENLPYTKALQLLAIPADEREEFARDVGVEDLSSRELAAVIKERDEARRLAEESLKREEELKQRAEEAEAAALRSEQTAAEAEDLKRQAEKLAAELEAAKGKAEKLSAQLDRAKSDPKIPPEKLEALKKEAEEAARAAVEAENAASEEELAELRAKLAEAEKAAQAAEEERKKAGERLAEVEKQMKAASPAVAEFKALFEAFQRDANGLLTKLAAVKETDEATAERLLGAIHALGDALKSATV